MQRFSWGVTFLLLTVSGETQQREPGVPDIPAMHALWAELKTQLSGPHGEKWFEENLRDSQLPYLHGILLSGTPKDQPHVLVLAMSDNSTPEVNLTVEDGHLTEKVREGSEVLFQGVAIAFSAKPFRLMITTDQPVKVHDPKQ